MGHRIALLVALSAIPALSLDFAPSANTIAPGATVLYFTPSGGTGPYSFAITGTPIPVFRILPTQGVLPASNPAGVHGAIAGVATTPGTYPTTITVTESFFMKELPLCTAGARQNSCRGVLVAAE